MIKKKRVHFSIRNGFQLAVLIATIGIGLQFYVYVHQSAGIDTVTVARPPGVEGFLPIGALMSWKLFISTGEWDTVHPAAMVILGFAVLLSFLLRKSFCGWFCPVGAVSEWCRHAGRFLTERSFRISRIVDMPLRGVKYILLGLFIYAISTMPADQIGAFVQSPYYRLSDVKMLFFFTRMTLLTTGVLTVLFVLSLFFKNFWCRYLCPYGALLGIFSWISPTRIQRDETHCTKCGSSQSMRRETPTRPSTSKGSRGQGFRGSRGLYLVVSSLLYPPSAMLKTHFSKRSAFVVFRPLTGKQSKKNLCVTALKRLCASSEARGELHLFQ